MPNNNLIKVGVVGCGAIAQIMHLPNLVNLNEQFELSSICDLSPKLLEFIGQKYGVDSNNRFTDYSKFLNSDIDAVFILTGGSHALLVTEALNSGKHVFCEKPLCLTLKDTEQIQKAVNNSNKLLMVGYMKRYDPNVIEAIKHIKNIKQPRFSRVTILHPEETQYFDIHKVQSFDDTPKDILKSLNKEKAKKLTDAIGDVDENIKFIYFDAMLNSLIHNTNLVRAVFGEPKGVISTQIWPSYSRYPTINTVIDYGDEHKLTMSWSYLSEVRNYSEEVSVYSDIERLSINFASPFLKNVPTRISREYMQDGKFITSVTEVSLDSAFIEELKAFHSSITTNKLVFTDLNDSRADIKMLQEILAAYNPTGLGGEASGIIQV